MSSLPKSPSQANKMAGQQTYKKLWRAPASRGKWFWLLGSGALYLFLFAWSAYAIHKGQDAEPALDPFRIFGICAFALVLLSASYSLRRRFVRALPGKVQNWLWMHTWLGIITILVALLHENYAYITHDFVQSAGDLIQAKAGPAALFALIFLVLSGITGRLLDQWQTRRLAYEAATNGVGIVQGVKERITILEETVERLCAGKSAPFKGYCIEHLAQTRSAPDSASYQTALPSSERHDFQRAAEALKERANLLVSLHRQQRAQRFMRRWRTIHIILASAALLIISYHSIMELLITVFHILPPD
ncbi:hypothetical protein [Ktedonobacter robiniae]|uniref:Ferric oxidoreductase domain-containing protein n=1 Tax=Ktedonobacter robiniae TaxID=2778365 RepID=A0ABQ3UL63_9CHLR|nr:hypothetical protein [Ktedonobacter robiniae]GHO53469.1 hypothetical protein KSB_19440 [Ktedonobacter robiniae]